MTYERCRKTSINKTNELRAEPSRYRWVIVFTAFFTFVTFAFVFQLVPPLLEAISSDFNLGEAQSGLLMSMAVIPGVILALPGGLIVNKYGFRSLGILSTLLVALGSLTTALATTFTVALFGRFLLGVGGTFITVGVPIVIPQWFPPKDLGKAMGIYATNMPVATILAFPTATILLRDYGWRYPFYVGTALSLIGTLIFAVAMREGPLKTNTKPIRMGEMRQALKTVEVWKASLVWMFFNTAAIAFLTWSPTLFQTFKSLDPLYASLLASLFMYAAFVGVPFFGWASDKSGRRKPYLIAGSVLMAVALNAIAYATGATLFVSVLFLGIAAAMVPPIVMTVAAESLPPEQAGTVFSVVTLCQNVGITLAAPLGGYLLETTGSLPLTFLGISLFSFAGAVTGLAIKTK